MGAGHLTYTPALPELAAAHDRGIASASERSRRYPVGGVGAGERAAALRNLRASAKASPHTPGPDESRQLRPMAGTRLLTRGNAEARALIRCSAPARPRQAHEPRPPPRSHPREACGRGALSQFVGERRARCRPAGDRRGPCVSAPERDPRPVARARRPRSPSSRPGPARRTRAAPAHRPSRQQQGRTSPRR